jgi:hypothetical protein
VSWVVDEGCWDGSEDLLLMPMTGSTTSIALPPQ